MADPSKEQSASGPGTAARSEGLLPADENEPELQVAEEVAFDLQSDQARQVGSMPADTGISKPATAIAESLKGDAVPPGGAKPDGA